MNVCVGEEQGVSCDNSERQGEHVNERERDETEDEYQ